MATIENITTPMTHENFIEVTNARADAIAVELSTDLSLSDAMKAGRNNARRVIFGIVAAYNYKPYQACEAFELTIRAWKQAHAHAISKQESKILFARMQHDFELEEQHTRKMNVLEAFFDSGLKVTESILIELGEELGAMIEQAEVMGEGLTAEA